MQMPPLVWIQGAAVFYASQDNMRGLSNSISPSILSRLVSSKLNILILLNCTENIKHSPYILGELGNKFLFSTMP